MDVQLRPALNGCVMALVTVLTLGLYALIARMGEGHFARRMDDDGVKTRNGKRVAWSEFMSISRVKGKVQGIALSDEYVLRSKKGTVSLPLWRVANPEQVRDYALQRLPKALFETRPGSA